jgi:hypothetical protein
LSGTPITGDFSALSAVYSTETFYWMTELNILQEIRIASPCTAAWDEMHGDDRSRFCDQCQLNVYNLSAMSPSQAAALVREKEGRLCVRYYVRPDGTMLTEECPVGFQAARRRVLSRLSTAAAALAGLFGSRWPQDDASAAPTKAAVPKPQSLMGSPAPPAHTMGRIAAPTSQPRALMGDIVLPQPNRQPAKQGTKATKKKGSWQPNRRNRRQSK